MYCNNCGKQNDDNNKFCVNCGQALTTDSRSFFQSTANKPQPEQHIFETSEFQGTERTDTGYFIIALLIVINVAGWFIWSTISRNSITSHLWLYRTIRVLSVVLLIIQFIITFLYTKKEVYKTIIAILGLLCSAYYIYYLIEDLKRF